MARLPRLSIAGLPHLILQRGNNRQWVFVDDDDRRAMVALMDVLPQQHGVGLHAYVLMPDHFLLLVTPSAADGLPRLMQDLGRRYVRHFNQRHGRSGTLWEGRYRSTLIEPEAFFLMAMTYLDLSPVRGGLAGQAADYPWSSYRHYAGTQTQRGLAPHALYWGLGNTPFAREQAYARMVQEGLAPDRQHALDEAVTTGWALGGPAFLAELQKATPRRVSRAARGRPRHQAAV